MKHYEKAIIKSIKDNRKMPKQEFATYLDEFGSDILDGLFNYINHILDDYMGTSSLSNLDVAFSYLERTLSNTEYDRKLIARKINKLDEKISTIEEERKNKFYDYDSSIEELERLREKVLGLENYTKTDINEYQLMKLIINKKIDIDRIGKIFKIFPNIVNIRDKNNITLYHNIIKKYLESVEALDEENILYYSNVMSTISSQKSFNLTETDRKKCLKEVLKALDKFNNIKGHRRERKRRIEITKNIKDMLSSNNNEKEDIEIIASKYGIQLTIPKYLNQYYEDSFEVEGREVNEDFSITIDKNAFIIDDALSCRRLPNGNYLLGVHIADPLGYYPYDNPVVQEAMKRESNIYLPFRYQIDDKSSTKAIPIFDYDFSSSIASLKENEYHYTRSHFFEISKTDGIIREYHPKTITKINQNKTFSEVEEILKNGTPNEELQVLINNLRDVTEILETIYKPQQLFLEVTTEKDGNNYSHRIVDMAQLLIGNKVADRFAENDYPCLYRVLIIDKEEDENISKVINSLKNTYGNSKINQLHEILKGLYPKGRYDTSGSHEGLNLDHYCRVHSPLRKAPDLLMEYAQEICFDKEPTDKELYALEEEIKSKKELINQKEDKISLFKEEINRKLVKRRK